MYIRKLYDENIGPIENLYIDLPFDDQDLPKPIVFVGENGSGKSTLISNVVDALYTLANEHFEDAMEADGVGKQYYKAISPIEINMGKEHMISYVQFRTDKNIHYIFKSGKKTVEEFKSRVDVGTNFNLHWAEEGNYKSVQASADEAEKIFNNNVICYFGPDRYEKPMWLGRKYYALEEQLHLAINLNRARRLKNAITVKSVTELNLQWLLDVIVDSRADIAGDIGNLHIVNQNPQVLLTLGKAKENLELIMSQILGTEVTFLLNFRGNGAARFSIVDKKNRRVLAPSLDSLSTGQIALFNMFSTIIRYADRNDINNSFNLDAISGIAVIDEIDLHLHTTLQREVLPKLIKLFPKMQFLITTHAPLFLLGMQETFGDDNYEIYEMPTGTKISAERFSEFQNAYNYFKQTATYRRDAELAIEAINPTSKTLIITEGSTDWKHMKAAFNKLSTIPEYADVFGNLEFDFFEYEPGNSTGNASYKLEMGNSTLIALCESMSKLPQDIRYILIADRDDNTTNRKLGADQRYKSWGNNVYSFILPVPDTRASTPNICIEHLYTDDEIKTEVEIDGYARRLFVGSEFDERGIASSIDKFCEKKNVCGAGSIAIIEGTQGDKVTSLNGPSDINYALPKSKFANYVLEGIEPFDQFDFSNFVEIFKIIKEIVSIV